MSASMYALLLLALVFANVPFLTQRVLGFLAVRHKHIGFHLLELALGFVIMGAIAYVLESRAGMVHTQRWEFYVVVVCLYLVCAFPAFVWRYFWQSKYKE